MQIRGSRPVFSQWVWVWVCLGLVMRLPLGILQAQTPVINEFLASNDSELPLEGGEMLDEEGDASDWIELYNPTTQPIDLDGWYLTDDANALTQWQFPQTHLFPGHFLVVFASGKNRVNPASHLHTNFKLSRDGGFLALVQPDGHTLSASFDYARQLRDVSYGTVEIADPAGEILVPEGAPVTVGLPGTKMVGDTWKELEYDDSEWLSGTTAVGYGYENIIGLNLAFVRSFMSGLYLRIPFEVTDQTDLARLVLRMKYDDGFVAYLNGMPMVNANTPELDQLAWDSQALSRHDNGSALLFEDFILPETALNSLNTGRNILAIHGLNINADSDNFLILPELWGQRSSDLDQDQPKHGYMSQPTPGRVNARGALDFVRDVTFSAAHGFYEDSFQLTLTSETPLTQIRYTLDGSTPSSTHGLLYKEPLTIYKTTIVRAASFKADYLSSTVRTQTYLFVSDVVLQSPNGEAPASNWPSGNVNGQMIDYGMDPDIVNHPQWSDLIEDALLDVPTISLVTDLENLFDRSTGIYVNPRRDGLDWERRTSVELIHADGTEGFDLDAGLRIRGAFSRSTGNPKHSFRLFFRSDYGAGKLRYPLFGDEGVQAFDKIDLRTSQNNSWAFQGSSQNTLIRDVFSRDVQGDMGQPYSRSRYYHLYLNGHYWGLYQTEERADDSYAESYLGGNSDDYDVVKNDSSGSRALHATAGTIDAYRRLYDAAVAGFETNTAYMAVQGLLPDGSVDTTGECLLNPENLMDYMICTYYTGDPDAPVSCWAHFSNNVFALFNHVTPQGFTWYRHDAEHSLGANGGLSEGRLLTDPTDRTIGSQWRHFNPAWLHVRLCENADYCRQFSDRVTRYFTHEGILTATPNIQRWMARADQIDLAIIAESARWGDAKRSSPFTRDHWQGQNDYMVNDYFPNRTQVVLGQMRSVDMFPDPALVSFNQFGGGIVPGFQLLMSQSNGAPGTIYYALGTDPRSPNGAIHPDAAVFTNTASPPIILNETTVVKSRVYNAGQWGALTEARFTVGLGTLKINELMASNLTTLEDPAEPGEFPDWIELYNGSSVTLDLGGMYLTDNLSDLTQWQIPFGTSLDPDEYLLVYADNDDTQGPYHTNFKLSSDGETLALVDSDGVTLFDTVTYNIQVDDVSYGRSSDVSDAWDFQQNPTPGSSN